MNDRRNKPIRLMGTAKQVPKRVIGNISGVAVEVKP